MMKKLELLLLFCSLAISPVVKGLDEAVPTEEETAHAKDESDPIKRLQKAYTLQKNAAFKKPGQPAPKKDTDDLQQSTPRTWKDRLSSLGKTYASDAVTGYGMNLVHTKFIQQATPDHPALIKGALFDALRIPHILDAIYRIPFKIGLYAKDDEKRPCEEYLIARTFVEDATVDYAVNYTYHAGILQQKVDHRMLLAGAFISACRLHFISDCIARMLCRNIIQN